MKKIKLIFFCVVIALSSYAQNINKTIYVDGLRRTCIIHLPPAFDTAQQLPLIIALHGGGGTAKGAISFYNLEPLTDPIISLLFIRLLLIKHGIFRVW